VSTASINGKTKPRSAILVRIRRKYLGWSQVRLAREASVSTMTVCNVESGRHVPDLSTIDRIAKALGVTPKSLNSDGMSAPHRPGSGQPRKKGRPPGRHRELTDRQREILEFYRRFHLWYGTPPTIRDIARRFGFSKNASVYHLLVLERKGHLVRNDLEVGKPKSSRTFTLTVPSGCCLCCGQPLPETPKDPWEA
jgi:transcriptional regulator with XRE-family HTH domain